MHNSLEIVILLNLESKPTTGGLETIRLLVNNSIVSNQTPAKYSTINNQEPLGITCIL